MARAVAGHHFRGHVLDGAAEGVGLLEAVRGQQFLAETEVSEHNVALAVQQNVLQLDVPVDDSKLSKNRSKGCINSASTTKLKRTKLLCKSYD